MMKLGAVIMPATTAWGPNDLADRIGRGRCVMASPTPTRSTNSLTSQGISTHRDWPRSTSMATVQAGRRSGPSVMARRPDRCGRPDADLLHLWHHQPAETRTGPTPLGICRRCTSLDCVLVMSTSTSRCGACSGDVASRDADGYITYIGHLHWPHRRRVQGVRLQDLPVRTGKRAH